MAANEYHFITHWRVKAPLEQVYAILDDPTDLVRWWPSVYLEATEIEKNNAKGIGRVVDLYTKGWLPYTLRWRFRVTERGDNSFTLEAIGDFVGRGIWTFEPDGEWTNITYDWKIAAEKPLLKLLSPVLKPVFSANHHWAMARGEESLVLEIARRNAKTPEERAAVPAPPPPTFIWLLKSSR